MNHVVKINNQELLIREYQGKRILTFKDIDAIHKRMKGDAKAVYGSDRDNFIAGEDVILIMRKEYHVKFTQNEKLIGNPNSYMLLLTKSGYCKLMELCEFYQWGGLSVREKVMSYYFGNEVENTGKDISSTKNVNAKSDNVPSDKNDLKVIDNELLPVYETDTGEKVVYGSELHDALGVKTSYKDWSERRLKDCDASENEDFQAAQICAPSGQFRKEHIIKLDTAKEMAMLERNEKGKQIRRYFIEVEKRYKEAKHLIQETTNQSVVGFEEHMRMAEMLQKCTRHNLPYVAAVLKPYMPESVQICTVVGGTPESTINMEISVKNFINEYVVFNRPTNDVYNDYLQYCAENDFTPISNIIFSKQVNKALNCIVIDKKIQGVKRRIFVGGR